jgi:hypothetical protein
VNGWLLALVLWLAFNGTWLLLAWLAYRRSPFREWEAELSRSSRETAKRQHPARGSR